MRQKTLTLLLAFVLMPVFALACAGGDTESDDTDADDTDAGEVMEVEGDAMDEGGDPAHGEEGHEHVEGDEGPAHGEEGPVHVEGDEMGDTAATPDTSGTH